MKAWRLATSRASSERDGGRAVELARRAVGLTGGRAPDPLDVLAAAYAESRRFPAAVKAAQQALDLATRQGNGPLAEEVRKRLKLYRAEKPFRATAQPGGTP